MKNLTEKELLVKLIRDDLINHRLIMGLERLGLVTELYYLHAGQTVFELMDIKEEIGQEVHFSWYMNAKDQVLELDLQKAEHHTKLNKLAEKIYRELRLVSPLRH